MKAETADYLEKGRATIVDARQIAALPLPHVAAREAYLAVFHAAQAYIFDSLILDIRPHKLMTAQWAPFRRSVASRVVQLSSGDKSRQPQNSTRLTPVRRRTVASQASRANRPAMRTAPYQGSSQ
jgi:hypothetical protein